MHSVLGLVINLEVSTDKNEISNICEQLFQSLKIVHEVVTMKNEGQLHLLHETGLKLWNQVIVKKLGKLVEKKSVAEGIFLFPYFTVIPVLFQFFINFL